ncbi:hypothetical protein LMG19083_03708 [Ralstonia psammae]|uniref:Uncharacterized protein n=1 Tax=Ralstonia psammae TaxID=3058598 RepID=A0ABM9JSV2_9RALS|nr:hypothetical protein LMG19083_03708 [Ralstonia sp. LMG 19083]
MSSKQGPRAAGMRTCANASGRRHHPREMTDTMKEAAT